MLAFCNSPLFNEIEAYITFRDGVFSDDGEVHDESMATFLRQYMEGYRDFVVRVLTVLPPKR